DFLANGIRLYHSRRFTTRAQPDAFVRISLSSNNLEILASGLSIVKEKIKNMNYNLLINKGIKSY
ncbi:hypothetical protein EFM1CSP_08235, partial [Enterococcus faecium]